jgi:hypothetical protein
MDLAGGACLKTRRPWRCARRISQLHCSGRYRHRRPGGQDHCATEVGPGGAGRARDHRAFHVGQGRQSGGPRSHCVDARAIGPACRGWRLLFPIGDRCHRRRWRHVRDAGRACTEGPSARRFLGLAGNRHVFTRTARGSEPTHASPCPCLGGLLCRPYHHAA